MKPIVRRQDDIPVIRYDNPDKAWKVAKKVLIGANEGAARFVTRMFTVEPGGYSPKHTHPWEHEIVIISGKGCIVSEDDSQYLESGMAVFVPPDALHQLRNVSETENFIFICVVPMEGE
jgi:quercetin dioxygenase-like cupin family protein